MEVLRNAPELFHIHMGTSYKGITKIYKINIAPHISAFPQVNIWNLEFHFS